MVNFANIKLSKDMVMLGISLASSAAGLWVDSYNKNKMADTMADLVVERMWKKMQTQEQHHTR